jgi:hypothetical protein
MVQVCLSLFQTFEALSFERRFLGIADAGLDLALGKKRALQSVPTMTQKFSRSRIHFIL